MLENVKHLVRHDKGRTFAIIMETLEGHLGYKVYPKVINADSVVPQTRQRIFLVGFKPGRASKPRQPQNPKTPIVLNLINFKLYWLTRNMTTSKETELKH